MWVNQWRWRFKSLIKIHSGLNFSLIDVMNLHCGSGDPSQECDDGNDIDGDGCSSTCQV
jgi:cysteine-rich repeat protein